MNYELANIQDAPEAIQKLSALKTEANAIARLMEDPYKERIQKCSEWLSYLEFKNGFAKVKYARRCRVRGCAVCDGIQHSQASKQTRDWMLGQEGLTVVSFDCASTLDDLTSPEMAREAAKKLLTSKSFKQFEYKSFSTVTAGFGSLVLKTHVVFAHSKSGFTGRDYISKSGLQGILGVEKCGIVKTSVLEVKELLYGMSRFNVQACSKAELKTVMDSTRKFRMFRTSQDSARKEKKVKPTPGETKNLTSKLAVFAPDVRSDYVEKYLSIHGVGIDELTSEF